MMKQDYLELLVENIHSTTIATIGADGHPQTRVIDMMLYDEQGVYFLTAHERFKQRQQDEVVRQRCGSAHNEAGSNTGKQCRFLGFAAFINNPGSDYIGSAHQKVGDLSDASGGGGQKLQGIFDKFNKQTGNRSEGKGSDECREVG